jgi:protein-tyrosine kinase
MSRVEEALRRAREAEGKESVDPVAIPVTAVEDVIEPADTAVLAREPFPIEMPERRPRSRPVSPPPAPAAPVPLPPREDAAVDAAAETIRRGLIERVDHRLIHKLVIERSMMPSSREQYRRLAASLHHMQLDGISVVMIASAVPGEGKTLTASNLALTLSESYRRNVLLIDGDLRRPTLHELFRVSNHEGLSSGLSEIDDRKLQVMQLSPHLCLLPAGRPNSDPMASLTSERMKRVLAEARETFDWVIVDTPPVGLLPDANLLGAMVDGAVLVIKAGSTPYHLVKRAAEAIGKNKIVGTVLNRAEPDAFTAHDGYYSGYYYGSHTQQTP